MCVFKIYDVQIGEYKAIIWLYFIPDSINFRLFLFFISIIYSNLEQIYLYSVITTNLIDII